MRGLPGSGKSTRAAQLAGECGAIHSTDDFFMVDGEYVFDPAMLGRYHDRNYASFVESLGKGVPVVICDNTNSQTWEWERYYLVARDYGYRVVFIEIGHPPTEECARRTTHGVPVEVIRRMIERWEEIPEGVTM